MKNLQRISKLSKKLGIPNKKICIRVLCWKDKKGRFFGIVKMLRYSGNVNIDNKQTVIPSLR